MIDTWKDMLGYESMVMTKVGGGGKERLRYGLPQSVCGHGKTNFELFTFIYVKIVTHKYIDL